MTLSDFFDDLAARWDAMMPSNRDAHLAHLLEPYSTAFTLARRVVDIGTGTGAFMGHLRRLAPDARILGLDISEEMLKRARARRTGDAYCCFLRADATQLPLGEGCFDVVTCHNSFAHLEDRAVALRGFARVLQYHGRLLILHDNGRERVNAIHRNTKHPRVQHHILPPVADVLPDIEAADFDVMVAEDADDHYLIMAVRT